MTLAATIAKQDLAKSIGTLMHGPTFMANPLACAVASAALELWQQVDWTARAQAIGLQMASELAPARDFAAVADLRIIGAIAMIEMKHNLPMQAIHAFCADSGVWLRPFGRLLYAMPPLSTPPEALSQITATMLKIARGL